MVALNQFAQVMNKVYMWRSKIYKTLFFSFILLFVHKVNAQEDSISIAKESFIQLGVSFDYLKLHNLLTSEDKKYEASLNINYNDKYHLIASYGISDVLRTTLYENADYQIEGSYLRAGIDYSFDVNPANKFLIGIRYANANYSENLNYSVNNPVFENWSENISRDNSNAQWFELVLTSEKRLNRLFTWEIPQVIALGMKFRIKSALQYSEYEFAPTRYVSGYGLTNTKVNPEINLYLKLRFRAVSF